MRPFLLVFTALFGLACAPPLRPHPRELAAGTFDIRERDTTIGTDFSKIVTTRSFGRTLTIERQVSLPRIAHGTYQFELNAAWEASAVEFRAAGGPVVRAEAVAGQTARWRVAVDAPGGAESREVAAQAVICDAPAGWMPLLRVLELSEGAWFRGDCLYLQFDGGWRIVQLEIERVADRGRRICYHLRIDGGAWIDLETDHRDWPLMYRSDNITISPGK